MAPRSRPLPSSRGVDDYPYDPAARIDELDGLDRCAPLPTASMQITYTRCTSRRNETRPQWRLSDLRLAAP
jgi:hypothetical protein